MVLHNYKTAAENNTEKDLCRHRKDERQRRHESKLYFTAQTRVKYNTRWNRIIAQYIPFCVMKSPVLSLRLVHLFVNVRQQQFNGVQWSL